ncbi:MAG: hypothetical protein M0R03_17375 [Novosphingobium sp.]|nr:hypothetical protein [Novosphingobium sp.]
MADKTVRIGVDAQEAQGFQSRMRQSAEALARDMIRSARQYSTSSKEVLRDIEEQIKAIEKRNRLDAELGKTRLENLRSSGHITDKKYSSEVGRMSQESREDALQIKLLRELIETVKHTSKEEIREDRKNVQQRISQSKSVGRLGASGDEFDILRETVQQDMLSETGLNEARQRRGFNVAGAISTGKQVSEGNIGGAAVAGGARLAQTAFSNPYTAIGAIALLAAGGTFMANKALGENLRGYGVSSQMSINEVADFRKGFSQSEYTRFGMTGNELLTSSVGYNKALGGRSFSESQLTGLTAITKARDVSPELLSQTLGFSRYSNSGGMTTVIQNLEDAIRKMYGGEDFKRKLIQLPEMMQVYNSLASQLIASVGEVNQGKLSSFVGGVGTTFGVEGQNLQRYSSGLKSMFSGGGNKFINTIQAEIIRRKFPELGGTDLYYKMQEIQEDPTSYSWFMKEMWNVMQDFGGGQRESPEFMAWAKKVGGFGTKEARKLWKTDFDPTKFNSQQGVSDTEQFNKYVDDASEFYTSSEVTTKKLADTTEDIKRFLGMLLEDDGSAKVTIVNNKSLAKFGETPNSYGSKAKP